MPFPGPWQTQSTQTGLTATLYDDTDHPVVQHRLFREDVNSEDPSSGSNYHYDPTLSFTKVTHDTAPTFGGTTGFGIGLAEVQGAREPWRGDPWRYLASMAWLGIPFDLVFSNQLPSAYPPDYDGITTIEFEFPPGSGQAAVSGDPTTQLYESAGVRNLDVVMSGLVAPYTTGSGQPYHYFSSALEVRLGSDTAVAGSSGIASSWQTPEELQALTSLTSVSFPDYGAPVYDATAGLWTAPTAADFPVPFSIPDSWIPQRYADGFVSNYLELVLAIDAHVNDVAPTLAPLAQSPTWPDGEDDFHQEYVWSEAWHAAVDYSGTIPNQYGPDGLFHSSIRAIWSFTFDWTPPRYRYVYAEPPFTPPLRQRQRHTGIGAVAGPPLRQRGTLGDGHPPLRQRRTL